MCEMHAYMGRPLTLLWGAPAETQALSAVTSTEGGGARAVLPGRATGGCPPCIPLHIPLGLRYPSAPSLPADDAPQ